MFVYFPSCNFSRLRPDTSQAVKEFLSGQGVRIEGCCRPGHKQLTKQDTAITICQTCAIILREQCPQTAQISLWEYLDSLPGLSLPDHTGETIVLQDCWRARKNPELHRAVRSLLEKMHYRIVELPQNREKAVFDGTWLYQPVAPRNRQIAPRAFRLIEPYIREASPQKQQRLMEEYASSLPGKAVCYCNSCLSGLLDGGASAFHLAELIFEGKS